MGKVTEWFAFNAFQLSKTGGFLIIYAAAENNRQSLHRNGLLLNKELLKLTPVPYKAAGYLSAIKV